MCLYKRDVTLLGMLFLLQLAQLCFLVATPEGRAGLSGIGPRAVVQPLARALVFTLPAAALIKLFHDWIGSDDRSVCMGRLAYLAACLLLCAAFELHSFASKRVKTESDLELSTIYSVRWWGLIVLFGAVELWLLRLVRFE